MAETGKTGKLPGAGSQAGGAFRFVPQFGLV